MAASGGGRTDGWSDEEDGPDALAADGARARRQGLPNCLMDGAEGERRQRRRSGSGHSKPTGWRAAANTAAQARRQAGGRFTGLTLAELEFFIRPGPTLMKNPAVLQTWRRAELEARAEEVRGKPIALQLGPEPEGYPEWLAAQARVAPTVNDDTTPPERPASALQR
eukprot:scaffold3467_cov120-Isochrysis_galbana.AAC.1